MPELSNEVLLDQAWDRFLQLYKKIPTPIIQSAAKTGQPMRLDFGGSIEDRIPPIQMHIIHLLRARVALAFPACVVSVWDEGMVSGLKDPCYGIQIIHGNDDTYWGKEFSKQAIEEGDKRTPARRVLEDFLLPVQLEKIGKQVKRTVRSGREKVFQFPPIGCYADEIVCIQINLEGPLIAVAPFPRDRSLAVMMYATEVEKLADLFSSPAL